VYQGNSQVLDQILTSPSIRRFSYDSVHINAEFADQNSDHDPQVLRFRP
jgi:predicted extracellular nuclease